MPKRTHGEQVLYYWECNVDSMGYFQMPKNFSAETELNKYKRFTGFMKEYIIRMVRENERHSDLSDLDIDREAFPANWWDVAIDVAKGKKVDNAIPKIQSEFKADKDVVYNCFIPAYRALKESFDKRWWFEWIFNHDQYVAERDTINALSGLMTSLTGDTKAGIDAALAEHVKKVPSSGVSPERRREFLESVEEIRIEEIKYMRKTQNIFNKEARNDIDEGHNFADGFFAEEIGDIDNIESEIDVKKEQVIFKNEAFGEPDDNIEIAKPEDEKDDLFIDNISEIGF